MMGLVVIAVIALIITGVISTLTFVSTYTEQRQAIANNFQSKALDIALSGIEIAIDSLMQDTDWTDCIDMNLFCRSEDSLGYYPLYSISLDSIVQDFLVNRGELTVKIKPIDANNIKIIAIGKYEGQVSYIGGLVQKSANESVKPFIYVGLRGEIDGSVCSYYWDGTQILGPTLPNFSLLFEDTIYFYAQILMPEVPAGDNPKNVVFGFNGYGAISEQTLVDTVYSTGDVWVGAWSVVDTVVAGGNVYVDSNSVVNNITENADWQFPLYNDLFTDNTTAILDGVGDNQGYILCDSTNRNVVVQTGEYSALYIFDGCDTVTLQGNDIVFTTSIFNYSSGATIRVLNENTELKTAYFYNRGILNFDIVSGDISFVAISPSYNYIGAEINCSDPSRCLLDVNTLYNYGKIQSSILARSYLASYLGSSLIGTVAAEVLYTNGATICNVVDSLGNEVSLSDTLQQTIYNELGVTESTFVSSSSNGVTIISQVICKDVSDCDLKLN